MIWIRLFILLHDKRHPAQSGSAEVEAFLSCLAVNRRVSASTRSQAKPALLFVYQKVLERDLPWLFHIVPAKRPQRMPTVLTASEAQAVLGLMSSTVAGRVS